MKTCVIINFIINLLAIVAGIIQGSLLLVLKSVAFIMLWLVIWAQHNEIERLKGE